MRKPDFYAVIMAGGGGTRLWPLSRQNRPKQMLSLDGKRTLFQHSVDRLKSVFDPDHIYIVTVQDQVEELQRQCPQIPQENYLIEPMPRGTASVVGYACVVIKKRDPNAVMAVLTADHYIENRSLFLRLLQQAYKLARENYLVTLGIEPTYPATGYGYLQQGEEINGNNGSKAFLVKRFREKPDLQTAQEYLDSGLFYWNSGMFVWHVEEIWRQFSLHMPQLRRLLQWISDGLGTEEEKAIISQLWPTINPETIDYGIMEEADNVVMIQTANLGWNDIGSWDSLDGVLKKDENSNILIAASHIGFDTENSVICSDGTGRLIVTIGTDEIIVVDTKDALLVCKKDDAQKVKDMVQHLKRLGLEQYL